MPTPRFSAAIRAQTEHGILSVSARSAPRQDSANDISVIIDASCGTWSTSQHVIWSRDTTLAAVAAELQGRFDEAALMIGEEAEDEASDTPGTPDARPDGSVTWWAWVRGKLGL